MFNDNDPFAARATEQDTTQHLVTLLTKAGKTWRLYQEDIDLTTVGGQLTNVSLPCDQWSVPLSISPERSRPAASISSMAPISSTMPTNMVFFTDSSDGNDPSTANLVRLQYGPQQQLFTDLENNTVADCNWITPDQFKDQHTTLAGATRASPAIQPRSCRATTSCARSFPRSWLQGPIRSTGHYPVVGRIRAGRCYG